MGKATHEARGTLLLYPEQKMMQAVLLLKDPSDNKYLQVHGSYGDSGTDHVEMVLMQGLYERYPEFRDVPNNSTIIFAAKWSPCAQCTTSTIPSFLEKLSPGRKGIRVKFRFESYYTAENWKAAGGELREHGGKFFWESTEKAQTAYDSLSRKYGIHSISDVPYTGPERRGITMKSVKTKSVVVMQPASVGRTSHTDSFSIS